MTMDDASRNGNKNQKDIKRSGCCGTPPGIRILAAVPFPEPIAQPCCPVSSGRTNTPGEGMTGTQSSSVARKHAGYWVWGLTGLAGITVLFLSAGILPGLMAAVFRHQIMSHLNFICKAVWSILPFFLVSVGISAWVRVSGFSGRIKAVFGQREKIAIAGAAVVGAIIPLCSCGVIPLIAALLSSGVPLGPVMAFWISSPLMSPSMFVLTAGVLGMNYAMARLVTAVLMGAGAGYLVYFLSSYGLLNNQLQGLSLSPNVCCRPVKSQDAATDPSESGLWASFWPQAWNVTLFLGKWLLIAFILESLIVHYVDPNWISALLGKGRFFSIPLATAIGIPVYTSGVGAIPIVQGLLGNGMSHGAALAFLVSGPVTTIPAMTAVFALVRRQTFYIYLGVGIIGSLIAGYLYQVIAG